MTDSDLLLLAEKAAIAAYCPYSHFPVGATVLASRHADDAPETWQAFSGCNVENVSYGLTICAERVAIMTAVAAGYTVMHRLAVWAKSTPHHAVTPCGACRQVLAEFMLPEGLILMTGDHGTPRQMSLKTLLPEAFSGTSLVSN